jgi:PQQ-like domain
MPRPMVCLILCVTPAYGQLGRGATDWTTSGYDAQRSSWVRADTKISRATMEKPGFQFLWKLKLKNEPRQMNSLMPAVLLDFYIGYRGFRSLAFIGGSSDTVSAIDTDLGRLEWQKQLLSSAAPQGGSADCPGGMTTGLTRPTTTAFPAAPAGRGGGSGRGGPARSGVGPPGEGAITLAQSAMLRSAPPAPPPTAGPRAPAAVAAPYRRGPSFVYGLSSDGMLHAMYVSNGEEPAPPIPFLRANANARGLTVIDEVAYAATTRGCGGASDGVWALELASKRVSSWKSNGAVAGTFGPAFGPDGTLYVASEGGELAALEAKTLKPKSVSKSGGQAFTSSPLLFEHKTKTLVVGATKDGRLHLMDTAALDGSALSKTDPGGAAESLASWSDGDGTRWVLASTSGAVAAWKVTDQHGTPVLENGWRSRDLLAPLPPIIVNGVVFVVSSGKPSLPAVLYALDARTGKELWSSGNTITSFVHSGGLSGGSGQLYLETYDGTFYAFGFPIEH